MRSSNRLSALALLASTVFVATLPRAAHSDDRDLLRDSQDAPYVFVIFDVSGSMNWQPAGDAWAPASADDPNSKFYQAKSALYRVIQGSTDIAFGFATYNQDEVEVDYKHWLYRLDDGQTLDWATDSTTQLDWPRPDQPLTFGPEIGFDGSDNVYSSCDGGGQNLNQTGNAYLEALGRINRFPKLGWPGSTTATRIWFRSGVNGTTYRFTADFARSSGDVGDDSIEVQVRIRRWGTGSSSCNSAFDVPAYDHTQTLRFVRFYTADNNGTPFAGSSSFLIWERNDDTGPGGVPAGFFTRQTVDHGELDGTCNGWDPNSDTAGPDTNNGFNIRQPTHVDPLPGRSCSGCLNRGDVIPLEWEESVWLDPAIDATVRYTNKDLILTRLAPNLLTDGLGAIPDFRQAVYFNDNPTSGRMALRDSDVRPLVAAGSTPIGASMANFRSWYQNWRPVAAANDPRFGCKSVTLLILTDGDETCNGNPGNVAAQLLNLDVETYVVGFGLPQGGGNTLVSTTCAGGGEAPDPDGPGPLDPPQCTSSPTNDHLFLPNNEDELVAALEAVFSSIREGSSTFASAAAPTLQANVEDKVVISSFIPLQAESVWVGRLDAYLKPVPVTGDGAPDRDNVCQPDDTSECLVWDAGDSQLDVPGGPNYDPQGLLLQAPLPGTVDLDDANTLQLGPGQNERRVFYSQFEVGRPGSTIWMSSPGAGNRSLLTFPVQDGDKRDLFEGFGIPFVPGDTASEDNALDEAKKVIALTLEQKQGDITDPVTGAESDVSYLMGDIFHSNPTIVDQPGSFRYYTSDPYVGQPLCGAAADPTRSPPVSYKWFADQHLCRRKMLFVASNDGQLHAFDAGLFDGADCKLPTVDDRDGDGAPDGDGDPTEGAFDNGTGKEIFSFVPRPMLAHIRELALDNDHQWGHDNTIRVDDVFIDPNASTLGSVTCLDREWRTVLLGSYREGGSGYYALDITQPDGYNSANVPQPQSVYVPSCLDGGADCSNRPFPYVLWEFYDSVPGNVAARMDEDANGWPDLANTWSVPTTGRIRVCDETCSDESVEDRFVAIFGGGLGDSPTFQTGNFVYMVDIESGQLLWKKPVTGSVPADIATVIGGDGYIKYAYFGTTEGLVYKVIFESGPMRIADEAVTTLIAGNPVAVVTPRIQGPVGDLDRYDPFVVFQTNGGPIYHEIALVYVQQRQSYALGFGTGDRWNLWSDTNVEGRFYMLLDTGFVDANRDGTIDVVCGGCPTPLREESGGTSIYHEIIPNDDPDDLSPYLTDPSDPTPGWYMRLNAEERIITEGFALSGITVFTSFVPSEIENPDGTCSRVGESHIFIVGTVSGAGYWIPDPDDLSSRQRYFTAAYFTSAPFVERGATGNLSPPSGGTNADQLTDSLEAVRDELKRLFPSNCRFGNFTQNIKTLRQDTRIVFIAPVPICIEPTNFKEF